VGVVTPGPRVPALRGNRVLYQDGVPVAALEAREFRPLAQLDAERELAARRAIVRRRVTPVLRAYLGQAG
jgi:ATP-dependent Lhr-like helicase